MNSTDPQETEHSQDDVATLYSWANLAGARYRDFSASRREVRSQARQRMAEQVVPGEADDTFSAMASEPPSAPGDSFDAAGTQPVAAADSYEREEFPVRMPISGPPLNFLETALQESMIPAASFSAPPFSMAPTVSRATQPQGVLSDAALATGLPVPERVTARWAALKGVFDPARDQKHASMVPATKVAAPVTAVFSLAGGVGKSSLVATLGRVLAARGERVLLVDATPYGTLPFYYGASELRPGAVRTFNGEGIEVPIQVLSLDVMQSASQMEAGWLTELLQQNAAGVDRILIDMGTASRPLAQAVLSLSPTVIVLVVPDMSSMVTLQAVKSFFDNPSIPGTTPGTPVQPYYLLNRFDAGAPMHEDIRALLSEQFGDRLLPLVLHASPEISEALAEGMTVADYAPDSAVNEDYAAIAEWVRLRGASQARKLRGVRWSEQ